MKRIIALILSCAICLTACGSAQSTESFSNNTETESVAETQDNTSESVEEEVSSTEKSETEEQAIASADPAVYQDIEDQKIADENLDLSDENLQQYLRDRIYTEAIEEFDSDEYCVENVQTIYYSKEYHITLRRISILDLRRLSWIASSRERNMSLHWMKIPVRRLL